MNVKHVCVTFLIHPDVRTIQNVFTLNSTGYWSDIKLSKRSVTKIQIFLHQIENGETVKRWCQTHFIFIHAHVQIHFSSLSHLTFYIYSHSIVSLVCAHQFNRFWYLVAFLLLARFLRHVPNKRGNVICTCKCFMEYQNTSVHQISVNKHCISSIGYCVCFVGSFL